MSKLVPEVCPFCGAGCGIYLQHQSQDMITLLPSRADPISEGRLCIRGWHLAALVRNSQRLCSPLINGTAVPWAEAVAAATDSLRELPANRVAILAAGHLTNEEAFAASYLGRQVLGTGHLDNFGRMVDGPTICGLQYSLQQPYTRPPLNDLINCDLIVCLNSNLRELNPQAGAWVKKAQKAGSKLIVIDEADDGLGADADVYIQHAVRARASVLEQLSRILAGEPELSLELAHLGPASITEALYQAADMINSAARVAIVLSARACSIPQPAMIAGKIAQQINTTAPGSAQVIAIGGTPNCIGLIHMGLAPRDGNDQSPPGLAVGEILAHDQQDIDGLIVIGEELSAWLGEAGLKALARRLQCLIVLDSLHTPTTEIADIAFPMAGFGEKEGSFTSLDGTLRWSGQVVEPVAECRYLPQIFAEIAGELGHQDFPVEIDTIWEQINQQIPGYGDIELADLRANRPVRLDETTLTQRTGPMDQDIELPSIETTAERPYTLRSRYDANWWIYDGRVPAIPALYREVRDLEAGYALMNPEDMEKERVRPGRSAVLQTATGGARLLIYPLAGIPEGIIILPAHQLKFLQRLLGFGEYDKECSAIYRAPVAAAVKRG